MLELVKQHLLRAQARMKKQADKGRSERNFAIGDMVFLKIAALCVSRLWLTVLATSSVSGSLVHSRSFRGLAL